MKRHGFTLLETSVALMMLAALTTLCLQFFAAANDQRRQVFAHLAATQEAANLLERVEALGWNELTTADAAKLQLSAQARQALPEGRVEMLVDEPSGTPPAKRVAVSRALAAAAGRTRAGSAVGRVEVQEPMMPRRGFTLIEMIVVMTALAAILAAAVVLMHFVLQMDREVRQRTQTVTRSDAWPSSSAATYTRPAANRSSRPIIARPNSTCPAERSSSGGSTKPAGDSHGAGPRRRRPRRLFTLPQGTTAALELQPQGRRGS